MRPEKTVFVGLFVALLLLGPLLVGSIAFAKKPAPVYSYRAEEPRVGQQGMIELLNDVELLKREVQQLRGEVELQAHTIEKLRKEQRQQYVDIDQRLNQLQSTSRESARESGGKNAPAPVPVPQTEYLPERSDPERSDPERSDPDRSSPDSSLEEVAVVTDPGASTDEVSDRAAYNKAFGLIKDAEYENAATAFRNFLSTYPSSTYADNAQYWLAETHYKTKQYKLSLSEFSEVLQRFPGSAKAVDARLKIGYIHYELQDWPLARQELSEVTRVSPNSTAARLAARRLERMTKEGH